MSHNYRSPKQTAPLTVHQNCAFVTSANDEDYPIISSTIHHIWPITTKCCHPLSIPSLQLVADGGRWCSVLLCAGQLSSKSTIGQSRVSLPQLLERQKAVFQICKCTLLLFDRTSTGSISLTCSSRRRKYFKCNLIVC